MYPLSFSEFLRAETLEITRQFHIVDAMLKARVRIFQSKSLRGKLAGMRSYGHSVLCGVFPDDCASDCTVGTAYEV